MRTHTKPTPLFAIPPPRPAQIGQFIAAAVAAADAADAALVFQIREREILTIDQTKLNMFLYPPPPCAGRGAYTFYL